MAVIHLLRRYHTPFTRFLTPRNVAVVIFLCTPLSLILYFAAGRLTVAPLATGVNRMDQYGCCSQAFLFPREQVPSLLVYFKERGHGYVDQMTEDYADAHGLSRWALTPSVIQHVGTKSSKANRMSKWHRNEAQNIWNFGFETNDPKKLKYEHDAYVRWSA